MNKTTTELKTTINKRNQHIKILKAKILLLNKKIDRLENN